jgi:hypothetical protein
MTEKDITGDSNPTFVYDGVEVYKTGRVAEQQVSQKKKEALAKRRETPPQMIEVKPMDPEFSPFKAKWVKEDSLFRVLSVPENSEEKVLLER